MVILFFILIIALIVIALCSINPIMRAVNSGIEKHNEKIEKERIRQEEKERKEAELEAIRKENDELKEKLKRETYINEVHKYRDDSMPSKITSSNDAPYYDWGLDEPVGMSRRGRTGDWKVGDWEIW